MKKSKLLKAIAVVMSLALLANASLIGTLTSFAESELSSETAASAATPGIDNSDLLPEITDTVTPIAVDGCSYAWTPDWISDLIIVELNVATASTDGKFSGMDTALEHLAEVGVNGIWLTPINQINTSGSSAYRNYGPDTVNTYLTDTSDYESGWEVVKNFVDLAHSYNIRVFFDLVTWGTDINADLVSEHPEYFESTSETNTAGGYSFDWDNTSLYNYMLDSAVAMITKTGADGLRADVGSRYAGTQFFSDIRYKLMTEHNTYIAMFSESPNDRNSGIFDFGEHSSDKYANADYMLFTENNIVDEIKNATNINSVGGKYYSSLISCHDAFDYSFEASGNSVALGYASILSPMIPIWYLGEEWKNASTNEYTVTDGIKEGAQLYRTKIDWQSAEDNSEYLETVKKYIRIRRTYGDIFSEFAEDNRNSNICKVTADGGEGLYQAYARYDSDDAVIVIPNNSDTAVSFDVTIPLADMGFDTTLNYQINDLMNDINVSYTTDAAFKATVAADSIGVYSVKKAVDINKVKLGVASSASDIGCSEDSHVDDNLLLFNIVFNSSNKIIPATSDVQSYYQKHITVDKAASASGNTTVGSDLCSKILINGKTVTECIKADNGGQYTSIHVQLLYSSAMGGDTLRICVPENNGYGVSKTSNCTIELLEGITFNGYSIEPAKFVYYSAKSTSTDVFASGGGYRAGNTANAGTVYNTPAEFFEATYENGVITLTADRHLENNANDLGAAAAGILINGTAISSSALTVCNNQLKIAYDNGGNDFKLYITNGITLNGRELNTTRYNYSAETEVFDIPVKKVTTMKYNAPSSGTAYISLQFRDGSDDFGMTMATPAASPNYYIAQYITYQSSAVWNETAYNINEYIKLNGETIGDINGRYKSTQYNYISSAINVKYDGYCAISFKVPYNNTSGISTVGNYFTVEILDGLMIDGFKIVPLTTMSGKFNAYSSSFGAVSAFAYSDDAFWGNTFNLSNGTAVVCDSNGNALSSTNTVKKGDLIYFKVTPNEGYQLQVDTLTYTYWYKGTKHVEKVKDAVTNETGTYYVFECPGVCGTMNATFIAVGNSLNAAVLGVHDRKTGASGMRFITRFYTDNIDLENKTISIDGAEYPITDYGTLVGFAWDELIYGASKAVKGEDNIYQSNSTFVDLKAEILNIPESMADIEFAARGYVVYNNGTEDVVLYTDILTRLAK